MISSLLLVVISISNLESKDGPDWIESKYENLPSVKVTGGRFNPSTTSAAQQEQYKNKCETEMIAEQQRLRSVSVSKFVRITPCTLIAGDDADSSRAYQGQIVFFMKTN